jgi:hypothetical protein
MYGGFEVIIEEFEVLSDVRAACNDSCIVALPIVQIGSDERERNEEK